MLLLLLGPTCMVVGCKLDSSVSKLKEQLEAEKEKKEAESKKYVEALNRLYEEKERSERQEKLIAELSRELETGDKGRETGTVRQENPPPPQTSSTSQREEEEEEEVVPETQDPGLAKSIDKLTEIADHFYWDGDYAVAQEIYDVAAELGATDPDTLFRLARCYGVTHETDVAISLYQKVIATLEQNDTANPIYHQTYNNLGGMYKKKGLFKEAELSYVRAIEINEGYTNAYYNLGLLYEDNLNDDLGAITCYERYIELGGERSAYIRKHLEELKARD